MNIDIRTTLLAMVCVNLVFAVAFLLIEIRQPRRWGASRLVLAGLSTALGFGGLALRGLIPDLLSILVANVLLLVGALAVWSGMRVLLALRPRRVAPVLLLSVFTVTLALFTYVWPSIAYRQIVYSLATAVITGLCLLDLASAGRQGLMAELRVLRVIFLSGVLLHMLRVMLVATSSAPVSYLSATQIDNVFLFVGMIMLMAQFLAILAMIAAQIDLQREQQQQALRDSDARFRDLVMMSSDWFWEQDDQLRFVELSNGYWNRAATTPQETLGKARWELDCLGVTEQQWAEHKALLAQRKPFKDFTYQVRNAAGELHWLSSSGKPYFDAYGVFLGYRGTGRDITLTRRLEQQRLNERDMLELLAQDQPLADFLNRLTRGYEAIFPDMRCSVLLLDADGQHLRHGAAPSLPESYCAAINGLGIGPMAGSCGTAAFSGRTVVVQDIATDPRWEAYRDLALPLGLRACWSTPIKASQGRVLGTFAIYHDHVAQPDAEKLLAIERGAYLASLAIERLQAEEMRQSLEGQLRESQKMEAIGTLAGGIAHDFNNIAAAILGNVELARQDAAGQPPLLESLDEIAKAGQRARNLTQQILSFSRRHPAERRSLDLCTTAQEAARLLRATLPARVEIACRCEPTLPRVMADPTQVSQALINLGTNAAYAIGASPGRIDLQLDSLQLDAATAPIPAGLRPGRHVRISVIDNGAGMDAATRERIFEPFFTTKPVGEGTGLGLSVAHGIMRAHEGAIAVHSEPGQGSRFELYFPAASEPVEPAPARLPQATSGDEGRGRHVIYIDDDEAMVFLIERMLSRRGYRVSVFTQAEAGLTWLREHPLDADLVVSDFNMPGLSGIDVALQVRDIRADLPVVVTTGYITDELRERAPKAGVREIIFKPDTIEELCDVIQRLLPLPSGAEA